MAMGLPAGIKNLFLAKSLCMKEISKIYSLNQQLND